MVSLGFIVCLFLVNTSYTQLQEYCRDINEKKADLEETNKYLESEKSDLEEKYEQLTEELNQLREQYQTSQDQCKSLQEQLESGASNGDNLDSRNQLLDEINMVEKDLEKVTKELLLDICVIYRRDQLVEENKALQANSKPKDNVIIHSCFYCSLENWLNMNRNLKIRKNRLVSFRMK